MNWQKEEKWKRFCVLSKTQAAFLEHGIRLNLIADVMPDAYVEGWRRT